MEVIDAAAELLNELFKNVTDRPWLLLENLWYAGHRFTNELISRDLDEHRRLLKEQRAVFGS